MLNSLGASGYHVMWRLLGSLEYVAVPQHRLRVYIVGFRKDKMLGTPQRPDPVPHRHLTKVLEKTLATLRCWQLEQDLPPQFA